VVSIVFAQTMVCIVKSFHILGCRRLDLLAEKRLPYLIPTGISFMNPFVHAAQSTDW